MMSLAKSGPGKLGMRSAVTVRGLNWYMCCAVLKIQVLNILNAATLEVKPT